jgi:hypothetical protein
MTIDTGVGPAEVRHRLALAVEPVDALTRRPVGPAVRVGRETPRGVVALETNGTAWFKLRHRGGLGGTATVRVDDPWRRYVPRRLAVPLWTVAEVEAADAQPPGPYVPVRSRLLRPWLLPGAAHPAPRTATGVRGRVVRAGLPVRWPRVEAIGPGDLTVGWAHGDERGEFLLLLTGTGTLAPPPPSDLNVRLLLHARLPAPGAPTPPPGADPLADLPREVLARSAAPPLPADLDNPLLRGQTVPAGYTTATNRPAVTVPLGRVLITPPFTFAS